MTNAQPQLGVAVDNNAPDSIFMEMYNSYRKLGISTVSNFGASMIEALSSPVDFPRLTRLTATTKYTASTIL
jgi:hypothetical protein